MRLTDTETQALARWAVDVLDIPQQAATLADKYEGGRIGTDAYTLGVLDARIDLCPLDIDRLRAATGEVCGHCWGESDCMSPTHRGSADTNACCICGDARHGKVPA